MYDYGKLTGRRLDIQTHDEDGTLIGTYPVFAMYDVHGEEWHDVFKAHPSEYYVALDGNLRVVSYETDPEHSQIEGLRILGLTAAEAGTYTRGPGGSAYDTYWDGTKLSPRTPDMDPLDRVSFKLGMLNLNITPDEIDAVIDLMPEPDRTIAKIYWQDTTYFHRSNPLIDQIAVQFSKTKADIDGAWWYALSFGKEQ